MINKDSFVKIINGVRDYWTNLHKFENMLDVYFEENWMTDIVDSTLDALFEDMEIYTCPENEVGLIYEFAFDSNFGQNVDLHVEINGNQHFIKNAEDLYDVLVKLKEEKDNEK